jgi:copper chaperone CopZ
VSGGGQNLSRWFKKGKGKMNKERLAVSGALLSAFVASLCCLGPLLFAALGIGAFSAASLFQSARPYLLGVAGLLLALGFYRAYFRRAEACAPGEACATKPVNRAGRVGLWIVSALALAFAFSPYYAGYITALIVQARQPARAAAPGASENAPVGLGKVTVAIEGMTCTSCESHVQAALRNTPGVRASDVSYKRGDARIEYDPKQTSVEQIRRAIDATGYKTRP